MVTEFGIGPDTPPTIAKHVRLVNTIAIFGGVVTSCYLVWFIAQDLPAYLPAASAVAVLALLVPLRLNARKHHVAAAIWVVLFTMLAQCWWMFAFGGSADLHMYLLPIAGGAPLLFPWTARRQALALSVGGTLLFIGAYVFRADIPGLYPTKPALIAAHSAVAHIVAITLTIAITVTSWRSTALAEQSLRHAQAHIVEAERQAALGRLAAGVVHEINTPLGVMQSSGDTLRKIVERCQAAFDGADEKSVKRARRSLERADALFDASRDAGVRISEVAESLARFTALDQAERKPVAVAQSVDSALALLGPKLDGVVVERDFAEDAPEVMAHAARLNQTLLTLIEGALDRANASVQITITSSDGNLAIRIADDGPPLPDDEAAALFDIGMDASGARVGMSVGMSLAKRTIDEQGGTLSVSSIADGNATAIALPIA